METYTRTVAVSSYSTRKASDGTETVRIAISSESPYYRGELGGYEILGHKDGEVDLSFLKSGAPFLLDHDSSKAGSLIGALENVTLDADGVIRADVLFSSSKKAQQILDDMKRGVRSKVSVGYGYSSKNVKEVDSIGGTKAFRVTRWVPMEASSVSVPADNTVGVGRAGEVPQAQSDALLIDEKQATPSTAPVTDAIKEEVIPPVTPQSVATKAQEIPPMAEDNKNAEMDAVRANNEKIVRLATDYGFAEKAGQWIVEGKSVEEVMSIMLQSQKAKSKATVTTSDDGLDAQELKNNKYSVVKAISNRVARMMGRNPQDGIEEEVTRTLSRHQPQYEDGILLPVAALATGKRDYVSLGTGQWAAPSPGQGSVTVFNQFGGLIDVLRPYTTAIEAGATVMGGLSGGPVVFPRLKTTADASWLAEGDAKSKTTASFDSVTLSPRRLQGYSAVSRELLAQASLDAENLVSTDLSRAIGVKLDYAVFNADSASFAKAPTGLYATANVGLVTCTGPSTASALTWGNILQFETLVASASADKLGPAAYITTPGVRGNLKNTLKSGSVVAGFIVDTDNGGNDMLNNHRLYATTQAGNVFATGSTTGLHGMMYGVWNQCMIGQWGAVELIVDPFTAKDKGQVELTIYTLADVQFRHPEAFAVCKSILVS